MSDLRVQRANIQFIYDRYKIKISSDRGGQFFQIEGLSEFEVRWIFPVLEVPQILNNATFEQLVFSLEWLSLSAIGSRPARRRWLKAGYLSRR